ncbi:Fpg/Nei family DNA glycosylase [Rhodococcus aerolatus]
MVHVHLGLYGKFEPHLGEVTEPRGAVRMRMVGEERWTDLRGAITCEVITADDVHAVTAKLGPDPLRRNPDPDRAWARIGRSRAPVAGLLMDQAVVAGIGNVYRAELLFRHHVDPYLPGRELGRSRWEQMWDDLVELMRVGVRKGRIVTVRPGDDHGDTPGDLPRGRRGGPRSYVYRRAGLPCRLCGTTVLRADLGGRNLFWCPTCQAS